LIMNESTNVDHVCLLCGKEKSPSDMEAIFMFADHLGFMHFECIGLAVLGLARKGPTGSASPEYLVQTTYGYLVNRSTPDP